MSMPLDPYAVPDHLAERFLQVKAMAEALQKPNPPRFFVSLTEYNIEGELYRASALTVSNTATLNFVQTGFVCDAFFPPDMITPNGRRGKKIRKNGTIAVRLAVELENILSINII